MQRVEPDQGLRVLRLGEDGVEVRERADLDVDALVVLHLGPLVDVGDAGGQEEVHLLVGEARRRVEGAQRLPVLGLLADLLGQLALGRVERRLALLVELAGRQLEQVGLADRLARLADEPEVLAVEHHDAHRAGMGDELALDLLAVLVAEAAALDREELALVDRLAAGALEPGAHAASSKRTSATSSIPSSAATETRSVASWLRSVPLARLMHGKPAAWSALASDPPPVWIRRGS